MINYKRNHNNKGITQTMTERFHLKTGYVFFIYYNMYMPSVNEYKVLANEGVKKLRNNIVASI